MLKSFFKTAARNMVKNRVYTIINFIGLTCGLGLALLIITYVRHELSFDQYNENANRLYRLKYDVPNGLQLATTPPPIAPKLKEYFPEIEETARLYRRNVSIIKPESPEAFEESGIFFADSAFTKMFPLEFIKGNPDRALHEKFTLVLNEEMAHKYFADENPIGESLLLSGKSFRITGVVKNLPENSHLRFNMLVPYDNMYDLETDQTAERLRRNFDVNFIISHSYTYVLLKSGETPDHFNSNMEAFLKKYASERFLVGQKFTLMPVPDIHVMSTLLDEPRTTNSMTNLYIFLGVGLLTLIIACINYINLSTAQSFSRIKEIGIRKILGSMKVQLIGQFLAESFIFCTVSLLMAFVVFNITLPMMNVLTGSHLAFSQALDWPLIGVSGVLLIVMTLLAGGYPAYFVTKFESVSALKGLGSGGNSGQLLRKSLVVFQLAIACMLLSGSVLIIRQLNFLSERPLGFQREQVINVPLFSQNLNGVFRGNDTTFKSRLRTYRNLIEAQAGITQTTLSSGPPGLGAVFRGTIPEGFSKEDNMFMANLSVDYDFFNAYDIGLAAGRGFSEDFPSDEKEGFIVNETAVNDFKWETPEKAIGKTIDREGKVGKVIGVVKDFSFGPLTTAMTPLIIEMNPTQFANLSIKFEGVHASDKIEKLEQAWNKIFPEKAFEYTFLDERLNQQYSNYENFGKIIQIFTFIGILISCLGVYGLVLFTVQRKVKEIGVRKVMGANVSAILYLIYRDFALLIGLGFLLAAPVSYYFMKQWLSNFIYHTSIDTMTYLISLGMVWLIVSLTICYQAIRAAQANPIHSLRSE